MLLNSQHKLVLAWVDEHGSILPAKIAGVEYQGEMFGSETSKRCRELRQYNYLRSERDGRFERFFRINKLEPLEPRMTTYVIKYLQVKPDMMLSRGELLNIAVQKGYRPLEASNVLDRLVQKFPDKIIDF